MLHRRAKGFRNIFMFCQLATLTSWFLFMAFIGAKLMGKDLMYEHINFPLYILGILAAGIISSSNSPQQIPHGMDYRKWSDAITNANRDILIYALVLFSIIFATKDKAISREFIGTFLASSWVIDALLNRFFFSIMESTLFQGENQIKTLIVGFPDQLQHLKGWIKNHPPVGIKIMGMVSPTPHTQTEKSPLEILGQPHELPKIISDYSIQQVILLESFTNKNALHQWMNIVSNQGCRIMLANPWGAYIDSPMKAIQECNETFFILEDEPLQNPVNRIIKRLFDITIALPVVIFIIPILSLIVKIAQSRQAPGPLLYKQIRSGLGNSHFTIYKFRSMQVDSPENPIEARQTSIFPFGAFIRKTSLDEFPQFINVLIGHMSVVGPRPHMTSDNELFKEYVHIYRKRQFAKPGITGLAQEEGYRGEIKDPEQIKRRVDYDLQYIRNWSIWLDISLVLRTLGQLLKPPKTAH